MQTANFSRAAGATVVASTVGNFVSATPMINSVFGLFLLPLAEEFHWPRASISAVLGIVAAVGALCYPLVGRLADRFGARRIVLIGNPLFAGAIAALSLTDGNLQHFYALFVVVAIAAALPSTVLLTKIISGWFRERRGLLLGITAGIGNGAGSTVMPLVGGMLIANFGWRGAYQGLGLIVLCALPLLWWLLRDPPAPQSITQGAITQDNSSAEGMSLSRARTLPVFWMMLIAIALGAGCMTAVFAHVVPMLLDRGLALQQATSILAVFALVCVVWQIAIGHVLDRARTPRVAAPFYFSALLGLLLFQHAAGLPALIAGAALMGIGLGTEYGVLPYYISRYFGLRAYGAIYGVMYGAAVLAMGITPYLMDKVFDRTASYDSAIYAICAALAVGAALIAQLPPYHALQRHRGAPAHPANPGGVTP